MATLTFLRIGKEIHDELEVLLADHLYERQVTGWRKYRFLFKQARQKGYARILKIFGIERII